MLYIIICLISYLFIYFLVSLKFPNIYILIVIDHLDSTSHFKTSFLSTLYYSSNHCVLAELWWNTTQEQ